MNDNALPVNICLSVFLNEPVECVNETIVGISPWDSSLTMQDAVVGWSAAEFAQLFFDYTSRTSTYHSASAAASVGVLVQAIEKAKSFDPEKIIEVLSEESFTTLYGNVGFDSNGQSQAPSLFLQYDVNSTVQTVYPPEAKSGDLVSNAQSHLHSSYDFLVLMRSKNLIYSYYRFILCQHGIIVIAFLSLGANQPLLLPLLFRASVKEMVRANAVMIQQFQVGWDLAQSVFTFQLKIKLLLARLCSLLGMSYLGYRLYSRSFVEHGLFVIAILESSSLGNPFSFVWFVWEHL